jgi:outer membrane protein TolC
VFLVSQAAQRVARNQYASGLLDFQTGLDAERTFVSFGDQLAQSKWQVTSNLTSLYKALGGRWTTMPGVLP